MYISRKSTLLEELGALQRKEVELFCSHSKIRWFIDSCYRGMLMEATKVETKCTISSHADRDTLVLELYSKSADTAGS